MKKSTHWITIPDEILHTPASDKGKKGAKKSGKQDVKNKLLWGVGFAVIIVVAFALLAPDQFNTLLKGSLFDTSGVTEEQKKISLIPKKTTTTTTTTSTDSTTGATTGSTTGTTTTTTSTDSTVKPEEKAVSISVTPVSTTTTTAAKDCKTDMTCFLPYLKDCSLAEVTHSYKVSDKDFEADLEITGSDKTDCKLTAEFTKSPETKLIGEEITCKLAQGTYTQAQLEKVFSDKDELTKNCTGSAVDTLKKYLEGLIAAATASADAKAVADLKKQLEALTKIVADTQTKPAAVTATAPTATTAVSTTPTATTTTTPTSVATTTTIGQPSAVTPGFKVNTNTVSITPQQMLQQNLASGTTYAQPTTTAAAVTTAPTVTTISTTSTPQTGPSEVILMALILTFLGLAGWKFVRTFA